MAGAYRLALSRATVTLPDGSKVGPGTLSVRDGRVTLRIGASIQADAAAVGDPERHSRSSYTVHTDGGDWQVSKDCGCSGGR